MAKGKVSVTINGKVCRANLGDTLIDAGLSNRIVLPHDCCSGQCETCRVRVISGAVEDYGTREKDTVLGCLATLEGDAEIAFDPVPVVRNTRGILESIEPIGPDLLEIRASTTKPVPWLPGQYVRLGFKGFPPRDYSPTFPLDLGAEELILVFHVKVYEGGRLSAQLGSGIRPGHPLTIRGPFGNAFLRRQPGRLVLVSTGTGFAPLWSIAVAAKLRQPEREIVLIAGTRKASGLYMREAVEWLKARNVAVTLTASDGDGDEVRRERPYHVLPPIENTDLVYAAGAPAMVDAVRVIALRHNASFFADPFFAAEPKVSLIRRILPGFRRAEAEREPAVTA